MESAVRLSRLRRVLYHRSEKVNYRYTDSVIHLYPHKRDGESHCQCTDLKGQIGLLEDFPASGLIAAMQKWLAWDDESQGCSGHNARIIGR